jgi:phage host-nuclease inhibitor protein Gam
MDPSQQHIEQYRQLVKDALGSSQSDLAYIRFKKEDPQHLAVAVIYATIIESGVECALLFQRSVATSGPAVLRSILESYADLCATIKDGTYVERMIVTFLHEKRRLLTDMLQSPGNPFHADLARSIDVRKELDVLNSDIKAYAERNKHRLSQRARLECAELPELIGSVYWQLCLESHNNISSLEARHIVENGEDFGLVIFAEKRAGKLALYLDTLLAIVLDSAVRVHEFFESKVSAKYDTKVAALQTFREVIGAYTTQKN